MKRRQIHWIALMAAVAICGNLQAQQWVVTPGSETDNSSLNEITAVDNGSAVLGVGTDAMPYPGDGFVIKVDVDGNIASRTTHIPGMSLSYYCSTQLDNGNYAVFGVCDDSLADPDCQHYLRVDIFDTLLNTVSSRQYRVDEDKFGFFNLSWELSPMRSLLTDDGTVMLVTAQRRDRNPDGQERGEQVTCLCFYEFDDYGDTIRTNAPVNNYPEASGLKCLSRIQGSANYAVFVKHGYFPPDNGVSGFKTIGPDLEIKASRSLVRMVGPHFWEDPVRDVAAEGRWDGDGRTVVSIERYNSSTGAVFQMLYRIDTMAGTYGDLVIPPTDSTTALPKGRSTAFINDSNTFVLTRIFERLNDANPLLKYYLQLALVDENLNLLGRRTLKPSLPGHSYDCSNPVAFNDGSCVFAVYDMYDSISCLQFVKMGREDIEITWEVDDNTIDQDVTAAYPNPARDRLFIPVKGLEAGVSRLRIASTDGIAWMDAPVNANGECISVDLKNLPAGLYVYQVVTEASINASGKFVKE